MIAAATDGSFGEVSVSVGNSSMVAVACENSDAIEVGSSNFVMWLLDGAQNFASSFHMVRS
jgi:hypothetical protein